MTERLRTIIAGSRGATKAQVEAAMRDCPWSSEISVVLSGTARGADRYGEAWATRYDIPVERYPADWGQYGKYAGHLRNEEMALEADALIAVWDGQSRGTKSMIDYAKDNNLECYIYRTDL